MLRACSAAWSGWPVGRPARWRNRSCTVASLAPPAGRVAGTPARARSRVPSTDPTGGDQPRSVANLSGEGAAAAAVAFTTAVVTAVMVVAVIVVNALRVAAPTTPPRRTEATARHGAPETRRAGPTVEDSRGATDAEERCGAACCSAPGGLGPPQGAVLDAQRLELGTAGGQGRRLVGER